MSYLQEFRSQIDQRGKNKLNTLWEEYCTSDPLDAREFTQILQALRNSMYAAEFGDRIQEAINLWETVEDPEESYQLIKEIINLQTQNSDELRDLCMKILLEKYPNDPRRNDKLRLVGLRGKENFQGALANYELLSHMDNGKFVYHSGGWGVGEIMDISLIREHVTIEFENVAGLKHFSFVNCFKNLTPLQTNSFLARRFGDPETLEKEAKDDPLSIIKLLLKELGPKTAQEIKEELAGLVIEESEWTKWWQNARSKLKKDTMISLPLTMKDPFSLRIEEVSHDSQFQAAFAKAKKPLDIISVAYNHTRDFPSILKNDAIKTLIEEKLTSLAKNEELPLSTRLQASIFLLQTFANKEMDALLKTTIEGLDSIVDAVLEISIVAFKKRALGLIKNYRPDFEPLFLTFLKKIEQSQLRDYLFAELLRQNGGLELKFFLKKLLDQPTIAPDLFVWFFQKITTKHKEKIPFDDKEGKQRALESFFTLLHKIEGDPDKKDLVKKMTQIITNQRFSVIRSLIEGSELSFLKEFLLLASKCHSLSDSDKKILRSLASVVQPSLAVEAKESNDQFVIWTTEEGYKKAQEKVKKIGTTDIVENAREIEVARAHGDLRENSEYKFALERRSQLQAELKLLSEQLNRARIITEHDISSTQVGVGNVVTVKNLKGFEQTYTILGPWEADAENHILSFQSKLAQQMKDLKVGDSFSFKGEDFTIIGIKSYL